MNDEKKQLLSHWGGIDVNKAKISMEKIFALFSDRNSNNIRSKSELIRQFHDLLGFRAKHGPGGLCAGCLYRTVGFIDISQSSRSGKRSDWNKSFSIHIEHTIPVKALVGLLEATLSSKNIFYRTLLKCSIATAVLRRQGYVSPRGMVAPGLSYKLSQFQLERPFTRYLLASEDDVIANVLSGEKVDIESYSVDDHLITFSSVLAECGNESLRRYLDDFLRD